LNYTKLEKWFYTHICAGEHARARANPLHSPLNNNPAAAQRVDESQKNGSAAPAKGVCTLAGCCLSTGGERHRGPRPGAGCRGCDDVYANTLEKRVERPPRSQDEN